jgi:hypothetical protein
MNGAKLQVLHKNIWRNLRSLFTKFKFGEKDTWAAGEGGDSNLVDKNKHREDKQGANTGVGSFVPRYQNTAQIHQV